MTLRVKENITNNFQLEAAEPEAKFGTLLREGTVLLGAHWVCLRSPAYTHTLGGTSQQGHWPAGAEMPVFRTGPLTRLQLSRYLGGDPRNLREVGKRHRDVAKSMQVCRSMQVCIISAKTNKLPPNWGVILLSPQQTLEEYTPESEL